MDQAFNTMMPGGAFPTPTNSQMPGGAQMNPGAPYYSRNASSQLIFQADGSPYRTSGRNPMKGDDRTYVDIHNINPYESVLFTYEGSHGYRDNSYLIFFPREEWYQERQKYSLRSVEAFRSVVDAMVQPVFEKEILRTTDNALFDLFTQNADNTGTTLQDINETAQTHARMLGLTFIVMDNFSDADQALTMEQALAERKFPYIYEKQPQDVYKWKCNNWGKLEWITFYDRCEMVPDPEHDGKMVERKYYRKWTDTEWIIYYEIHNEKKFEEIIEVVESRALHGLTYMPIYPVLDYTKNNNLKTFPNPLLADIANMSFVLYNLESWIMLLCVWCFPILTMPPMDGMQIALSATNGIEVPNDAKHAPAFISPPTQCLETLLKAADRLADKIYKAANQIGVSGTKAQGSSATSMASGVSKEWDFRASNVLLTKTAMAAKKLEEWCAKTFADYTHTAVKYNVDFPCEFVEAYSQQRLQRILDTIKEMPPERVMSELWKEFVKVFWDDDPDKALELTKGLDADYAQGLRDKAAMADTLAAGGDNAVPPDQEGAASPSPNQAGPGKGAGSGEEDAFKQLINGVLSKFGKGGKVPPTPAPKA